MQQKRGVKVGGTHLRCALIRTAAYTPLTLLGADCCTDVHKAMNLELLHTVDQSYPEHNEGILDSGSEALTCSFNRRGTQLAVGCNDGRIAIWNFMTRGIARICSCHIHPITSLSWNRSGTKLLSSSTDWNVLLWDIATGDIDVKLRFPSPILKAQFHPRKMDVFLVCPMKSAPVLLRRKEGEQEDYVHTSLPTQGESEMNIVASFDRRGGMIVTGSSKGKMLIIDTKSLSVLKTLKFSGNAIKSIEFPRRGSHFLVNSADRVIRVFDLESIMEARKEDDMEPLQKLQDLVNRTQWRKCTFSGDGEFIVAGSHRQHELYIWDKATGSLVKMLTGQKGETLLDIAWHPVRPIILSISNGVVNTWSQAAGELWSAYAPNFKELDENEEYEEREDEFDIEDEDNVLNKDADSAKDHDDVVDVVAVQPIPAFCSSDEEDLQTLDWLPMAPEIEDPEEPGWGQLEPSLNELPVTTSQQNTLKRAGPGDENSDPSATPPQPKQPRTVEINLPDATERGETERESKGKTKGGGAKSKNGKAMSSEDQAALLDKGTLGEKGTLGDKVGAGGTQASQQDKGTMEKQE